MSRKLRVVVLLLATTVGCVIIGFPVYRLINASGNTNAYDEAIQSTERLLSYVQEYSVGPPPRDVLPSYLWVSDSCWAFLQEAMLQNSGQYSLTARDNGIPFRPVDDILVRVNFTNGHQIDLNFYEGGLVACSRMVNE